MVNWKIQWLLSDEGKDFESVCFLCLYEASLEREDVSGHDGWYICFDGLLVTCPRHVARSHFVTL